MTEKIRVIADFNAANLVALFNRDEAAPVLHADAAPFGQVGQAMASGDGCASFVWVRPASASPAYRKVQEGSPVTADELRSGVARFCEGLALLSRNSRAVVIASWSEASPPESFGSLALRPDRGPAWALLHMNLALAEFVDTLPNAVLLDSSPWVRAGALPKSSARLWYLSKTPYTKAVFERAVHGCKQALRALSGRSRKLLLLDLDNTLWGGVLGDLGPEKIRLGGHDAVGEAFQDVQREALRLGRMGIALGVISKNDETHALQCIREHPEMLIRGTDLAGWRINWEDKAQNIAALVTELNLGLDSVVFVDDNPVERSRIRQALPEVEVPELPDDPLLLPDCIRSLGNFDAIRMTGEDADRSEQYQMERQRRQQRDAAESLQDWLHSLGTVVTIEVLDPSNLPRAAQLLNKTNQMNLATRRMSEQELADWAAADGHDVWTFRVADNLGDAGLTGVLSLSFTAEATFIEDLVLSCRVMGRGVEESLLAVAVAAARRRGSETLVAEYRPTPRNGPCLAVLERAGLARDGNTFSWRCDKELPWPSWLQRA